MASPSKQFRDRLKAAGLWEEYEEHYAALLSNGEPENGARRKAAQKFAQGAEAGKRLIKERNRKDHADKQQEKAALVDPDVFEGKEANEAEVIRWVAANLTNSDARPEDAPSATAWSLLADCQRFPQFRIDFWKSLWTKLVSKGQIDAGDDEDEGNYDGEVTVNTINDIWRIKEQAERDGAGGQVPG